MIARLAPSRRAVLRGASLLAWPQAAQAGARTAVPDALAARFRALHALTARFREERHLPVLAAPLVREGSLAYEAPSRLAQRIERPAPARVVIVGRELTLFDGGERQVVDLDAQPAVGLLVSLLLALLSGDVERLSHHATAEFTALAHDGWQLKLRPVDASARKLVAELEARGRGVHVDRLVVLDGGGGRTVTDFSAVTVLDRLPADVRARHFG